MGIEILCIKVLSEREPFLQILFINNLMATLIGVFPMILFFKTPNIIQLIELVTIAGAMVLGQFFFLNAMKGTETTFIAPFFYSTLVFVMILDLALFGVIPECQIAALKPKNSSNFFSNSEVSPISGSKIIA